VETLVDDLTATLTTGLAWFQILCQLALLYLARVVGTQLRGFAQWHKVWLTFAAGFSCMLAARVVSLFIAYGYQQPWMTPVRLWVIPTLVNLCLIAALGYLASILRQARPLEELLTGDVPAHITITADSRVTSWDHAAEVMFGYTTQEAVGADLTELIMPVPLRAGHRAGMARYQESTRTEPNRKFYPVPATHKDGHEFPVVVELNIVPQGDGTLLFAGTVTRLVTQ